MCVCVCVIYIYICMCVCMCAYFFKHHQELRQMNNEWNTNFLPNFLLALNKLIPASFPLVEAPLKLLFWYGVKLISFNVLYILRSYNQDELSLYETKKHFTGLGEGLVHMEVAALAQSCLSLKILFMSNIIFNPLNSLYNQDDEIWIRILHSFLNRSINIIMDLCYIKNSTSSQVI